MHGNGTLESAELLLRKGGIRQFEVMDSLYGWWPWQIVGDKTWPASVLFWPPRTDLQVRAQEGLRGGGPAARVGRPTVARSEPYAKKIFGAAGRDQNNTEAGQLMGDSNGDA